MKIEICPCCGKAKRPKGFGEQGDSRQFAALVAGAAACVTSPPYADSIDHAPGNKAWVGVRPGNLDQQDYGTTPGQLGALPCGDAVGVTTSPRWVDPRALSPRDNAAWVASGRLPAEGSGPGTDLNAYGATPGNVGGLPAGDADSVVTSPPYEGCEVADLPRGKAGCASGGIGTQYRKGNRGPNARKKADGTITESYGTAPGQVGALRQETYWDAVRCIYGQCLLALRPGGVACVVVKDFVRARRRVPLCDQAWRLLLSLGFTPVERIRCLLTEETREPSLFGGCEVKKRSRVSFFRRLATKRGAPEIPWEEILVVRRPLAGVP